MRLCLFAGNSNRPLANKIAETLGTSLGQATMRRFSDGEVFVEIGENVRGKDVYIMQSTCAPVNGTRRLFRARGTASKLIRTPMP